jgi:basic membrane protein A
VNRIHLSAILVLTLFISILPACAIQPSDCNQESAFCVGLVTAYDGVDDHGLNQATWEALQDIESQTRIARLDKIESIDTRDWEKNILFFADKGYDVIITVGRDLGAATTEAALEYPSIFFIGIDQEFDEVYANLATIYFIEEQAGFIAGALASMVTETDMVGAICETSGIDEVWRFCEGFREGVAYNNEDVRAYVEYRDSGSRDSLFNDPEWGAEKALSLIDNGVDVVTGYGGKTTEGGLLAASDAEVLVIGTEEDLYFRLIDLQPVLITSIVNDPTVELTHLVLMASREEISSGPFAGQIKLAPFRTPQFETATLLQTEIEKMIREVENGEIQVDLPEKE